MYSFYDKLALIHNSGQARGIILGGNIHDLFFDGEKYVPLTDLLIKKISSVKNLVPVVFELNAPVRIPAAHRERFKKAWGGEEGSFDEALLATTGKPTVALEFLRQLTIASRLRMPEINLFIVIEAADMILPAGEITNMNDGEMHRISIVHDWFSDPAFLHNGDTVVLLAESPSLVHQKISRLPQTMFVEVPSPDHAQRKHYIDSWDLKIDPQIADFTAGLTIHALRQLLTGAKYTGKEITAADCIAAVECFVQQQIGEDVVEFSKPEHRLDDLVGFTELKAFLRKEFIPRMQSEDKDKVLTGAAVAGALGSGKTYIFEAVAAELGMPVLVLKNLRSQWFGQTDVIFERLRRVLEALHKVVVFVDEADTQFGSVQKEEHSTERRLTGKIQAMMSDSKLRGKIMWLLMTARINQLSPDIRRPGRVGDLIIPVLDPEDADHKAFVAWMVKPVIAEGQEIGAIKQHTQGYSAAAFSSLRSDLKAMLDPGSTAEQIMEVIRDRIPPDIGLTRKYQTLQALVNCTRRNLLPKMYRELTPSDLQNQRDNWEKSIRALEAMGIQ